APARRLRRLRQRGLDPWAQPERRPVTQIGAGDHLAHRAIALKLRGAARAARDMLFDGAGIASIQFVVDQRVKQDFRLIAGHFGNSSSAIQADRSMARARARRDITVPTGAPTTSAISR